MKVLETGCLSLLVYIDIDNMRFAVYLAVPFIIFFRFYFVLLYICLYVLYGSV